ncbi:LysR family transcriptional regulator [Celeribacter persicus]|uniref:LysR family transcriptional regulator n=1 Tax=Celeribacter persicus TaxID=1651082 RepID=A0A2T5HUR4_9RHOB|nr:LysR family transcriptional regulator [Celeribacter persicus]PTQ75327.1 LysR family transcriptional regulator [Celeribacter persicus]
MTDPRPTRFDLNLIKVFLTIWDVRSLTVAGTRLGLTQPAISHGLKRLREQFNDPLFLRVGNVMEPTEAATRLREPFEAALSLLEQTLQDSGSFRPATSSRGFRIAMTDTGEFFSLARILSVLEKQAPDVELTSFRVPPEEMESALRSGQADLALGYLPDLEQAPCQGQLLVTDRLVCLFREGHPVLAEPLTEERFVRLSFLDVSRAATGYQMGRTLLQQMGVHYRVKARLDHFTVVPEIIRRTDYVAIFPQSIAARLEGFATRDLPFDLPSYDIKLWVHDSFAADPGITWLRGVIVSALTEDTRR